MTTITLSRTLSLLIALVAVPAVAHADQWFGTITFRVEQRVDEDNTTSENNTTRTVRKHVRHGGQASVTYLADGTHSIYVRARETRYDFTRTVTSLSCNGRPRYGDTVTEHTGLSEISGQQTKSTRGSLEIHFEPDGSYRIQPDTDFRVEKAKLRGQTTNYFRSDCRGSKPTNDSSTTNLELEFGLYAFAPSGKAENPAAQHVEGTDKQVVDTHGAGEMTITAWWSLHRRRPAQVKAVPGGPYSILRGDEVKLDGSGSTGPIRKYTWALLADHECPTDLQGRIFQFPGPEQSFPVLCSMSGVLIVEGQNSDERDQHPVFVDVTPREWTTPISHAATNGSEIFEFLYPELTFGRNRCELESTTDSTDTIHWDASTRSWSNSDRYKEGYELAQVTRGPFGGYWFIAKQALRIPRRTWINSLLLPGGRVYELNAPTNKVDYELLLDQIPAHERVHTLLMQERLEKAPSGWDPAQRIEGLIADAKETLRVQADDQIREVQTELKDATNELQVVNRFLSDAPYARFRRAGKLLVPDTDGGTTTLRIRSFAEIGNGAPLVPVR